MKRVGILAFVFISVVIAPAASHAQGLGDAAARAKQKRKDQPAPAKVFTDADLSKDKPPADAAADESAADGETAAKPGEAKPGEPVNADLDREREERKLQEAEWRMKFANARRAGRPGGSGLLARGRAHRVLPGRPRADEGPGVRRERGAPASEAGAREPRGAVPPDGLPGLGAGAVDACNVHRHRGCCAGAVPLGIDGRGRQRGLLRRLRPDNGSGSKTAASAPVAVISLIPLGTPPGVLGVIRRQGQDACLGRRARARSLQRNARRTDGHADLVRLEVDTAGRLAETSAMAQRRRLPRQAVQGGLACRTRGRRARGCGARRALGRGGRQDDVAHAARWLRAPPPLKVRASARRRLRRRSRRSFASGDQ